VIRLCEGNFFGRLSDLAQESRISRRLAWPRSLRAIHHFREALRIHTIESAPFDYARAQLNLGAVYCLLKNGKRTENQELAIACFVEASRVFTRQSAPREYAKIQLNMGVVYASMPSKIGSENQERAIACFRETDQILTPESDPLGYAKAQTNMGAAYAKMTDGDPQRNRQRAIDCYRKALKIFTPEVAPAKHRAAARNLGNLHFRECRWDEAHEAHSSAIYAVGILYKAAGAEVARQAELAEGKDLFTNDAYCLARLSQPVLAIERLERSRTRSLREALAFDRTASPHAKHLRLSAIWSSFQPSSRPSSRTGNLSLEAA
jgi:tetratricopeptide (TPR) repeat protein